MRQASRLVIGPIPQPRHPTTASRASCHQLPELIARLNQLVERLQHFQQRYRTQLSRTDQKWLYHSLQQVAFDLAKLTHLADMGGVAPDAPKPAEPLQRVEPGEQLVKQITLLAQNTTAMVQTALLPQQRTGM